MHKLLKSQFDTVDISIPANKMVEPYKRYSPSKLEEDDLFYGVRGQVILPSILIVGESWGAEEARMKLPFMGKSGLLLELLLIDAGININECAFANVVNHRPPNNDMSQLFNHTARVRLKGLTPFKSLYPFEWVYEGINHLEELIKYIQPDLIIGLGNYTLWALTGESHLSNKGGRIVPTGIGEYRGSQLYYKSEDSENPQSIPFLPTYHPASTFRTYAWRAMIRYDLTRRVPLAFEVNGWEPPATNFIIRPSFEEVIETLEMLLEKARNCEKGMSLAVDIETRNNFIACIGVAWTKYKAICIPILTTEKDKKEGYWSLQEEVEITLLLEKLLTHDKVRIIGQNFSFDVQYIFSQMFFLPKIADDTMIKHHTAFPGGGDPIKKTGPQGLVQKSLNHLSSLYCKYHRYWKDEGKTWETSMPEEQLWTYNCKDCCATFEINEVLTEFIADQNLEEQYNFQMDQINNLAVPMMLRGVKINTQMRNKMAMELFDAVAMFETRIDGMLPKEIADGLVEKWTKNTAAWYRSPVQLAKLFYDELGIRPVYNKAGNPTTDKGALPIIAKREPIVAPIVEALGTLRSLGVFYDTFITSQLDIDNRMRCSFNVAGTDTFRWSSSTSAFGRGTNLQNIPKGDDESKVEELKATRGVSLPNIRKIFIPDTGYLIVDADLSGADAQVVAWEADEPELKELLKSGVKIHSKVAKQFHDNDGFPYYDMCKRRIHATNYGAAPQTLCKTLAGLYGREYSDIATEQSFQEYWFNTYPGIKHWHERVQESLNTTHGVKNQFGNRIIYQDRIDSVFTKALAWIPQSTIALLCNRGALAIVKEFPFVQLLLQVHDSIVFQIPKSNQNKLNDILKVLNSIAVPYADPLYIQWSFKVSDKSWGE